MDKLIIALLIPGAIILCLVAGKRLWVRAVAILLLLFGLGVILPNIQYDRSRVALVLQTMYLTEFGLETEALLKAGEEEAARLRLAEFNRRFRDVSGKPGELGRLMLELKAITNSVALDRTRISEPTAARHARGTRTSPRSHETSH